MENNVNEIENHVNYQTNQVNDVITKVKIVGLNVCGLRTRLRNGIFEEFAKNYDILCLSETRMQNIDLQKLY